MQTNDLNRAKMPQECCTLCSRIISLSEEAGALFHDGKSYEICCKECGEMLSRPINKQLLSRACDATTSEEEDAFTYHWLKKAVERQASDLFLSVTQPPILKVFDELLPLQPEPLSKEEILRIITGLLPGRKLAEFNDGSDVDIGINVKGLSRFRINVFREMNGNAIAIRPLPFCIPSIDELLLPGVFHELSHLTHGLILITGPTGSGKSTTLAALVNRISQRDQKHIITIEDPIEYIIPSQQSLIHQREIGTHVASFSDGLRSALREHPDIIVVGELRDLESISLAVRAAETGHLVLGTLHSGNAVQAITRLIDVFDSNRQPQIRVQLSQSLQAVISQRLFKRQDKPGMAVATEIMIATLAVRTLIRENRIQEIHGYMETGMREQMNTLRQSIEKRIHAGILGEACLANLDQNPVHELKDAEINNN